MCVCECVGQGKRLLKLFLRIDSDNWRQLIDGLNQNTNTDTNIHIVHTYIICECTTVAHLSVHCTLSLSLSLFVCLSLSLSVCRWHFKLEGKLWLDLWRLSVFCLRLMSIALSASLSPSLSLSLSSTLYLFYLLLCFMFLYLFALHVLLSLSFTHFFVQRFYRPATTNRNFFLVVPQSPKRPHRVPRQQACEWSEKMENLRVSLSLSCTPLPLSHSLYFSPLLGVRGYVLLLTALNKQLTD